MNCRRYYFLLFFSALFLWANAQSDRFYIRQGNKFFHNKDYANAEVQYRKAIAANNSNPQALYNLGCALSMQQKDSAAVIQYEQAAKVEKNKLRAAKSYHNIGVVCQSHQMFDEAIKAYQQSLRLNPNDNETRYNLALCKRQQKQQKQDNKDDQKKQNQKNDKDDQGKQNKQEQKPEQKPNNDQQQMSKENAEQLLNAAIQNEKATQQRMKKAMQQPQRRNVEKNW